MARAVPLILALAMLGASPTGCFVDSQCSADYDCAAGERCNVQLLRADIPQGRCFVECRKDSDCFIGGAFVGKRCLQSRCEFMYDERVQAPGFCMTVVNPAAALHGKDFCLSSTKGRVTLLYFAWLT
jgi:hypothetical protein